MQAVILAAGQGKRLQPLSFTRSKAMMPVLGKPIVERVMEDLAANGIDDFILIVSPEDREIVNYFQRESKLEAAIRFAQQPERHGMAHALGYAAPLIQGDFFLSACDNLISAEHVANMLKTWRQPPSPAGLLTLMPIKPEQLKRASAVVLQGDRVTGIVEKPDPETAPSNIASLPLYCFSPRLLEYLPKVKPSPRGEYELQDAIQMLIDGGAYVRGIRVEKRLQLTTAADLIEINAHYLSRNGDYVGIPAENIGAGTRLHSPVFIEAGTVIGANCAIGPNVYIEAGCRIGDHVTLGDALVLRSSNITGGRTVVGEVILP